mmetsp:Transcript_132870/g.343769  ORF Transcript_132870/g.343769 Transcript_132870/m.343769 type:complete len:129 (+) Transcript_132870:1735-2121(+)
MCSFGCSTGFVERISQRLVSHNAEQRIQRSAADQNSILWSAINQHHQLEHGKHGAQRRLHGAQDRWVAAAAAPGADGDASQTMFCEFPSSSPRRRLPLPGPQPPSLWWLWISRRMNNEAMREAPRHRL